MTRVGTIVQRISRSIPRRPAGSVAFYEAIAVQHRDGAPTFAESQRDYRAMIVAQHQFRVP